MLYEMVYSSHFSGLQSFTTNSNREFYQELSRVYNDLCPETIIIYVNDVASYLVVSGKIREML